MYEKYAVMRSWTFETLNVNQTDMGGIREAVCSISGEGVFRYLKFETGVHRVQRVPVTEASGRIHTSTITCAVLPQITEKTAIEIAPKDLKIETYKAGGPGGQHVNKTESAVRITHIPTGLVAASQADRSQHRNRAIALDFLKAKLVEIENNKKDDRQTERKAQIGTGDRSERIRTYNFPQDRITDHRISQNFHGIEKMMRGELLYDIHTALLSEQQHLFLKNFN